MVCQSRIRRHCRSTGLVVLYALSALVAAAQVTTELSEQAIAVGELVSYIITIDHEEPADVEVRSPDFPGLRLIEGPTVRPISILSDARRERAVEVRFTLEAVAAGRYVLPQVPVRVAGQPYLTDLRLLEIGERRNRTRVPFLARWSGSGRPLRVGEARVYTLEIYNVPEYLYPDTISVESPANAIMEEVQGLGTIEQYAVDGVTLYAIPVAVFMVTPSEPGELELPRSVVATTDLSATADVRAVPVLELPEAVEASGAVGSFTYTVGLDQASVLPNESATLRVRVAGTGNLHFLAVPEPEIRGLQVEREETVSSFTPTEGGYEGYVERVYEVRPVTDRDHRIVAPEFVYFDPATDRIRTEGATTLEPEVLDLSQPLAAEGDETTVELLDRDRVAALERRVWYRDPLSYGWLVPGLLVLVASRIWKRRDVTSLVLVVVASGVFIQAVADRLPWDDLDRGYRRYEEGNLPAAITAFERSVREVPDSPGLNYNLAVLYFTSGDVPRSVYAVREAIRLAPFAGEPRLLLQTIERSAGISRSVPPPHLIHPDLAFLAIMLLWNALFVGIAVQLKKRRTWMTIAGILVVVLLAGAVVGLTVTGVRHEQQLAVVRGDVTLTRVPGPDADGWLPVHSGAAVRVLARHDGSYLVQTVLGLEGWVKIDDVIWNESPVAGIVRFRGFVL